MDLEAAEIIGTAALYFARKQGQQPWSSDVVEAAARRYDGFGGMRFVEGSLNFSPDGNPAMYSAAVAAASRQGGRSTLVGPVYWPCVCLAGLNIHDKHIEVITRQMMRWVREAILDGRCISLVRRCSSGKPPRSAYPR